MTNLETKWYDEKIDQKVFKEILDALTFIEPEFLSREEYNKLSWNILQKIEYSESEVEKNKKSIDRKDFKLFLPESITNNDKIFIFSILDKEFSKELWFISATKKIKSKIFYAIQSILDYEEKNKQTWKENNLKNSEEYSKLEELYKKMFNEEKLPNISEIQEFLKTLTQKEKLDFKRDYISLARKIWWNKTKTRLGKKDKYGNQYNLEYSDKKEFWEILDSEIDFHFEELFFRQWVNNLRFGLNIMTLFEQVTLKKKKWEIIWKNKYIYLNLKEKLLRDKIQVEKYKKELEEVRKTWDKEKIAKKEIEATNAIIRELHNNFPYQLTKERYWEKPSKIQQSKELQCIWFSIVWHVFLKELWIKHKWLSIPWHSALEINIWWKKYLFDATKVSNILIFKYWSTKNKIWENYILDRMWLWNEKDQEWNEVETLFHSWNTEKILLSQIYYNKWNSLYNLWKYEKAIEFYDKSIELNPKNAKIYYNKWNSLSNLWKWKIVNLYYDVYYLIEWESTEELSDNKVEQEQIKIFINNKNFDWLRLYLLELEKKV